MSFLGDCFADAFDEVGSHTGDNLGDVFCVEGDCKEGESNIQIMMAFFATIGSPVKFQPAVGGIVTAFSEAENSATRNVPFTPVCCQVKAIGVQAAELVKTMAADAGVAPPPELKAPQGTAEQLVKAAKVLALGFGVVAGVKLLDHHVGQRAASALAGAPPRRRRSWRRRRA